MEAQHKRKLRDGREYDALLTGSDRQTALIRKEAGVPETLALVQKVVLDTLPQTAALAKKLEGANKDETSRNVWNFLYRHIQYHLDDPGVEQVRTPARSWADRVKGIDCEDFSVFASSILLNLGIPHKLRISAYARSWQHIYVIVPKVAGDVRKARLKRADYYTIDPVTDAYDYEVPPTKTQDTPMELNLLSGLSGLGDVDPTGQINLTYLSDLGDLMGVDDLGKVYVHDDRAELGGLGELGAWRPFEWLRRFRPVSKRKLPGTPVLRHDLPGAAPAGAVPVEAAYESESGHTIGLDGFGGVYVYDEYNATMGELGELAGLGLAGVEELGQLGFFKAVKRATKKVGQGVSNAGRFVGKTTGKAGSFVSNTVQRGVFDPLNKIPGVKFLADNVGADALQFAAGAALTAATGGAAAPALIAVRAAQGANKTRKVVGVIQKANALKNKLQKGSRLISTVSKVGGRVGGKVAGRVAGRQVKSAVVNKVKNLALDRARTFTKETVNSFVKGNLVSRFQRADPGEGEQFVQPQPYQEPAQFQEPEQYETAEQPEEAGMEGFGGFGDFGAAPRRRPIGPKRPAGSRPLLRRVLKSVPVSPSAAKLKFVPRLPGALPASAIARPISLVPKPGKLIRRLGIKRSAADVKPGKAGKAGMKAALTTQPMQSYPAVRLPASAPVSVDVLRRKGGKRPAPGPYQPGAPGAPGAPMVPAGSPKPTVVTTSVVQPNTAAVAVAAAAAVAQQPRRSTSGGGSSYSSPSVPQAQSRPQPPAGNENENENENEEPMAPAFRSAADDGSAVPFYQNPWVLGLGGVAALGTLYAVLKGNDDDDRPQPRRGLAGTGKGKVQRFKFN